MGHAVRKLSPERALDEIRAVVLNTQFGDEVLDLICDILDESGHGVDQSDEYDVERQDDQCVSLP